MSLPSQPNIDSAVPASITARSAGWICAIASANGAFEVASDEPRMPCAIT